LFEDRLKGGADAAARARSLLGNRLDGELDASSLHEVLLATTELVTNAVRHGGGDAASELTLQMELGEKLRIAVVDPGRSRESPQVRPLDPRTPGGLGLYIVEQITESWGVERGEHGTTVWFEMIPARAPRPA